MAQLPSKAGLSNKAPRRSIPPVGTESVTDVMIRETRTTTLVDNVKTYPDVIKNNAKNMGIEAVSQTAKDGMISQLGLSGGTADQLINVAKYGGKAKDSLLGLGTKSIDHVLGTNTSELLDQFLPSYGKPGNSIPPAGAGRAATGTVLDDILRRNDPAFSFSWRVQLPWIEGLECLDIEIMNSYVEDVTLTLPNIDVESVFRNSTRIQYPKFSDSGTLTLVFYEDHDLNATTYVEGWRNLVQDRNTMFYNLPSLYKKDFFLVPVDSLGVPCGTFIAKGAFPTNVSGHTFASSSNEPMKISVEFGLNRLVFYPFDERDRYISEARARMPNKNNTNMRIRPRNVKDILKNPVEFARQAMGKAPSITKRIRF